MDLQNTFYVLGIVVMCLTLIMLIVLVVAVLVIRAKINAIHKMIEEKVDLISNLTNFMRPAATVSKVIKEVKRSVHPKK